MGYKEYKQAAQQAQASATRHGQPYAVILLSDDDERPYGVTEATGDMTDVYQPKLRPRSLPWVVKAIKDYEPKRNTNWLEDVGLVAGAGVIIRPRGRLLEKLKKSLVEKAAGHVPTAHFKTYTKPLSLRLKWRDMVLERRDFDKGYFVYSIPEGRRQIFMDAHMVAFLNKQFPQAEYRLGCVSDPHIPNSSWLYYMQWVEGDEVVAVLAEARKS